MNLINLALPLSPQSSNSEEHLKPLFLLNQQKMLLLLVFCFFCYWLLLLLLLLLYCFCVFVFLAAKGQISICTTTMFCESKPKQCV